MTNKEAISLFHDMQGCRHQALYTNDCGDCERCKYYHTQEQLDEAVDMAISALEKQEQDRWIPVTERLPKDDDYKPFSYYEDGAVLYCTKDGKIGFGWYYESTRVWANEDDISPGEVIAWRPLPEPYTEEES